VGISGALTSPLLNPAFLWSGACQKSNERSGVQKIKWSVRGAGGCRSGSRAVSETIVNGAER